MIAFRNAYIDLLNSARPVAHDPYALPQLRPAVDHQTWQTKRSAVAESAGTAARAYARHGGTFTLRNAAYIMNDVDPVTNWEMTLRDPEQFSPETVGLTPFGRSGGCVSRPVARGSGQGDWSDHDEQQEASHPGAGRP